MSERPPLTAEEFLAALEAGRAEDVEERRVHGTVIFRGQRVRLSVRALYVSFEGEVDFSDTVFEGGLDFSGCTFATTLSLRNVRIDGDLNLDDIQILNQPSLWGRRIPDTNAFDLSGAEVSGNLELNRAQVLGDLTAKGIRVEGGFTVRGSEINGDALLSNSIVSGDFVLGSWASSYTEEDPAVRVGFFNGELRAVNLQVHGAIDLHGLHVAGAVHLWGGNFESSVFARPLVVWRTEEEKGRVRKIAALTVIGGELSLAAARVTGVLQLNSVRVAQQLRLDSASSSGIALRPYVEESFQFFGPPCEVGGIAMFNADIGGTVALSLLVVMEGKRQSEVGARFVNTAIRGDLLLWHPGVFSRQALPTSPDILASGAVVSGDFEVRGCEIHGNCELTNLWASGAVRLDGTRVHGHLTFRSRTTLLDLPLVHSLREQLCSAGARLLRGRATALDLSRVHCDGSIDITGLDLQAAADLPDLQAGAVRALAVRAGGEIMLHARRQMGATIFEDVASIPGTADFERARAARFAVSARTFDEEQPRQGDVKTRALRLTGADFGEVRMQPVPNPRSRRLRHPKKPRDRYPTPVELHDLSVQVWSLGDRIDARRFKELLRCDPTFRRSTFVRVEQNLRNGGHEVAAVQIYREMCRRERAQKWRDASRWPDALRRWPIMALEEVLIHAPYAGLMGFGTAPLRLLVVIALLWGVMLPAYHVRANFQPTLLVRSLQDANKNAIPSAAQWRGWTPFFVSFRYHLPVVGSTARGEWELADHGTMCWSSAEAADGQPPTCRFTIDARPEDVGLAVTILNWALWPLVLTFTIRRLIR